MPWCPANKLKWYSAIILFTHISGTANTADFLSGVNTILNNYNLTIYIFPLMLLPF